MLFLDTLEVNAWNLNNVLKARLDGSSIDTTFYTTKRFYGLTGSDVYDFGGSFANFEGTYEDTIVFPIDHDTTSIEIDPDAYYYVDFQLGVIDQRWCYVSNQTPNAGQSVMDSPTAPSGKSLTLSNMFISDFNGVPYGQEYVSSSGNWRTTCFIKGRELINGHTSDSHTLGLTCRINFNAKFTNGYPGSWNSGYVYFVPHYTITIYTLRDEYKYNIDSTTVTDTISHQQLDTLNDSTEQIEDSVTNPTGTGILGTIKNFFSGFFGWLHDTILGLFVPESGYFTTWFNNVNTLLSQKLGMLYAPFDLLLSVLNAVYGASSSFSGIPFPEIRWGDTVLVSSQTLTFSNLLGEHFADIQGYVYFGTDVVLLFAFLMLLQRKINLILRGRESG